MSLSAYISLSVILLRAEVLILYRFFTYDFGNLENGYRKITERINAEWLIEKTMWKIRGKKQRKSSTERRNKFLYVYRKTDYLDIKMMCSDILSNHLRRNGSLSNKTPK